MFKRYLNTWSILPIFCFIFFITPVLIVISSLFGEYSDNWSHLYNYVLGTYITNSIYLVTGVLILVALIGVSTAWLVTNYDFFLKNILEWALILPLAVPPYILAYTFTGLFDTYGTANNLVRDLFNLGREFTFFPKARNVPGAIIVFSFTLYPYVYLVSRMAFINQSKSILETGRTLGLNKFGVFYKLAVPMIRPAIIAGLMLVAMETLSDFGAVDHFAISTFTTGIFRTWYGMYDIHTAKQLASLLLIIAIMFITAERYSRKNADYSFAGSVFRQVYLLKLTGLKSFLAFVICFIPIFIGFILPILELSYWAFNYKLDFFNDKFISTAWNSFYLAIITAFLCTLLAIIINFSVRYKNNNILKFLSSFLTVGYAVPGIILAIGVMQLLTFIDSGFIEINIQFVLTGSLVGLIIAYIIKSYALASSTIESGYQRVNKRLDDVARSLKTSGWPLLTSIHLPLLKTSFLTSVLLVVSEVIKELPATLILRPFNFDTLAVYTYIFAAEERMYDAAAPSIAIVMIGLLPIIILTRMIRTSRPASRDK
ncbi:MAG: iron ABC transporter permease [Pelagibacterales bacterium]|nr:iron ABC transporter permease [Pelagibacterales bacterium]